MVAVVHADYNDYTVPLGYSSAWLGLIQTPIKFTELKGGRFKIWFPVLKKTWVKRSMNYMLYK